MVIDQLAQRFLYQRYDRNGEIAANGLVHEKVLFNTKAERYFRTRPPKTAGREEFGTEFVDRFIAACRGGRKQDIITTATVLTAFSIRDAIERFVPLSKGRYQEVIVSGGGLKNATLMGFLQGYLSGLDLRMRASDELGLPSEAKEAAAFALLAYETWHKRPSNVPCATGAKKPTILGKISYA
jgi:anhydro-N-acetylmuramic acid kinase